MRIEGGGYRRDYLRALAQRVEVDAKELRIIGAKNELLRTLVAASGAKAVGFGVPSSVPKWRARKDSNSYLLSGDFLFDINPQSLRFGRKSAREWLFWMLCRERTLAHHSGWTW
jgi:hypothetical protein